MRFLARYVDAEAGQVVERQLEAASRGDLLRDLDTRGHTPIFVREDRERFRLRSRRLDLRSFAIEFRSLLMAGLGIVGSLEALAAAQRDAEDQQAIREALTQVRAGKALSAALESAEGLFPPLFRAAVRAGESSGRLPDALQRFAQYLDIMGRLRQSVISAAIYPAIVTGFGLLVLLFLLGYVVPRFAVAYEALPPNAVPSNLVLGVARAMSEHFDFVLIAVLGLAWAGWSVIRKPDSRAALLAVLMRLGPIAEAIRAFHFARLYRSLSMMIGGGYTVPAALQLAEQVLRGTPWATPLTEVGRRVAEGKSVAASLADAGFTNEITSRLLLAGERSAQLAEMFDFAAEHYERELAWRVERGSRILEPALLILVAGMIGLIVLLMYMPIFDLATAVG